MNIENLKMFAQEIADKYYKMNDGEYKSNCNKWVVIKTDLSALSRHASKYNPMSVHCTTGIMYLSNNIAPDESLMILLSVLWGGIRNDFEKSNEGYKLADIQAIELMDVSALVKISTFIKMIGKVPTNLNMQRIENVLNYLNDKKD